MNLIHVVKSRVLRVIIGTLVSTLLCVFSPVIGFIGIDWRSLFIELWDAFKSYVFTVMAVIMLALTENGWFRPHTACKCSNSR